MPYWHFRQMQPGEMNVDPIEAEFFSTEALDSLADALVREALQNSLDARRPGEQARVRIGFSTAEAQLNGPTCDRWTNGIRDHVAACHAGLAVPLDGRSIDYLVIEDFGTRGLQGDPLQTEDDELDAGAGRNDFYYFWRNIGRSRKAESELGRWGLGKTVFPAASRINAFFAYTTRADDAGQLLMGQAVLRIHKIDGHRHAPYGYFADFDTDFARPLDEPKLLTEFRRDFHVERHTEPGLSVVIPFPDSDLTPENIAPSVVRHYFVPILSGDLVVDIDVGHRRQRFDAGSLPDYLEDAEWDGRERLARLVELARWAQDPPAESEVELEPPPEMSAPSWSPDCLEAAPADLRARFDAGQRLAFQVPVWVKPAQGDRLLSQFDVYLERDDEQAKPEEHFVRDGITVAGVRGGLPKGMRALIMVRDGPLATLLGDSENPAHTEWQERSPKFKDRYTHGPTTLRYVRNAAAKIVAALTRPAAGRDETLLRRLFSLEVPTEAALAEPDAAQAEDKGRGETPAPETGEVTADRHRVFELQRLVDGFRLAGTGNGQTPPYAVVRVAYDVRRGNPFAQYQAPDFNLNASPIRIRAEQAKVMRCAGNLLVLQVEDPDFCVTVRGFDKRRDIRVRLEAAPEGVNG